MMSLTRNHHRFVAGREFVVRRCALKNSPDFLLFLSYQEIMGMNNDFSFELVVNHRKK
jgi:hypothetical protein